MAVACRHFFSPGGCRNGDACRFSHTKSTVVAPCRHFLTPGGCRNGDKCPFAHVPAPVDDSTADEALLLAVEAQRVPVFAVDVECVATGPTHLDRAVAQIGVVDWTLRCALNAYVKPDKPVQSYLTPLTGLTPELIGQGVPLDTALANLREVLPPNAVVVGTNVGQDATWLKLKTPDHVASLLDIAALFRVWDQAKRRYTYFGQDHVARVWLGHVLPPRDSHNAVDDAAISMMLLQEFLHVRRDPKRLAALRTATAQTPRAPSFAVRFPVFEGVCQGNRRLCKCGAPHFS